MEKIFNFKNNDLFNQEDLQIITELEKRYFEVSSYQNLLTSIIPTNLDNLDSYNFYFEKYVEAFEKYIQQQQIFTVKIINRICPEGEKWNIDFLLGEIKVKIND